MNYYTLPKEKINKLLRKEGVSNLIAVIIDFVIMGIMIYGILVGSYIDNITHEVISADNVDFSDKLPMLAFCSLFILVGVVFLIQAVNYFVKWPRLLENNPEAFVEHFRFYRRDSERRYTVHLTQPDLPSYAPSGPRNKITYLILKWEEEQRQNQGTFQMNTEIH